MLLSTHSTNDPIIPIPPRKLRSQQHVPGLALTVVLLGRAQHLGGTAIGLVQVDAVGGRQQVDGHGRGPRDAYGAGR